MEPKQIIAVFTNAADGVESRVTGRQDGALAVNLYDLDAEACVPVARVFPALRLPDAVAYAKSLIK